jgi:hypothetical protein
MKTFRQGEREQAEREGRAWDESGTASPYAPYPDEEFNQDDYNWAESR